MALADLNRLIAEAAGLTDGGTATERRHALIRRMAGFYTGSPSLRQKATRMARDLNNYQKARWRHDVQKPESEIEYQQGGKTRAMYQVMKATGGRPPGNWRIEEILSGRKCGQ